MRCLLQTASRTLGIRVKSAESVCTCAGRVRRSQSCGVPAAPTGVVPCPAKKRWNPRDLVCRAESLGANRSGSGPVTDWAVLAGTCLSARSCRRPLVRLGCWATQPLFANVRSLCASFDWYAWTDGSVALPVEASSACARVSACER